MCHSSSSQTVPCLLTWGEEQGKLSDVLSYTSETRPCGAASCGSQRTRAKSFKDNNGTRQTRPGEADTHVCGWVGSSPRETVSPWISLKHFSQKWYLSAISPNFGELHRSPKHGRSRTAHGREGSHRSVQDMGRVGCHERSKQEVGAQHSRKSSSQQPGMILKGERGDWGGGVGGDGRESVWRCMVGQGKSKPMLTAQPSMGREGGQTSDGAETGRDNTQQRAKAKALIRKLGHERMSNSNHHHSRQSRSGINTELGFGRGGGNWSSRGRNVDVEQIWTKKRRAVCWRSSFKSRPLSRSMEVFQKCHKHKNGTGLKHRRRPRTWQSSHLTTDRSRDVRSM